MKTKLFILLLLHFTLNNYKVYGNAEGNSIYVLFKKGKLDSLIKNSNLLNKSSDVFDIFNNLYTNYIDDVKPLSKIKDFRFPDLFKLKLKLNVNEVEIITILNNTNLFEFVELEPKYKFYFTPNDLNTNKQYSHSKIKSNQAWDLAKGNRNIVLAIVDDAVDTSHTDLRTQIWRNKTEIKNNGIDDDGNGYIDDWFGWDAADGNNNPNPPSYANSTNFNHGTHCAGIAAASTNNNNGIASIGFNLSIMPVKIGRDIDNSIQNAFEGVEYAILNGANTISMSWGGGAYSNAMQMLFDYARSKDIVCVAAAGNDGKQNMKYPAAYRNVISVGSTDNADKVSGFSNFGNWLDVFAPGSDIYSTVPGNSYVNLSGTSMACPLVAGLCGLMKAYKPDASAIEIEQCLKSSCDDITALNSNKSGLLGAGRINAYESLLCLKKLRADFKSDSRSVCQGQSVQYSDLSSGNPITRVWKFEGGNPAVSSIANPIVTYNITGEYKVELIVNDGLQSDTSIMVKHIKVYTPSVRFTGNKLIEKGSISFFTAHFTGDAPFMLIYTDGINIDTIENIFDTTYDIVKTVNENTVYWPLKIYDNNCVGIPFDTAKFKVTNSKCNSEGKFIVNFGSGRSESFFFSYETKKNEYITFGHSDSLGNNDVVIQKIINGNIISGNILRSSNKNEEIYGADKLTNGFLIYGRQLNGTLGDEDAMLIKVDNNGNYIWSKLYGGSNKDFFYRSGEFNKNLILAGSTMSFGSGHEDIFLLKLDSNGNIIWSRSIGNDKYNRTLGFDIMKSGNFFVGSQRLESTGFIPVVLKLNQNGDILKCKEIPANYNSDFFSIKSHNGFLYLGARIRINSGTDLDILLMKVDTSLNTVYWSKQIYTASNEQVLDIEFDNLGNVLLTGISQGLGIGGQDGWIFKISPNGSILSSAVFGQSLDEIINSIENTADGGIILTGQSRSNVFSNNNVNGYLQKFDCEFKSCNLYSDIFNKKQLTYTLIDHSFNSVSGASSTNLTLNTTPFKLRSKYLCADTVSKQNIPCRLKADFGFEALCAGTASSFYDKSIDSNNRTIRSRKWIFDNEVIEGPAEIKYAFTAPGMHTVSLYIHSGDTVLCSEIVSKQVWISDSLKVEVYNDTIVCVNDSATLGVKSLFCGTAPFTYKWSPANGLDKTNAATVKAAPVSPAVYTLTVTDANGKTAVKSMQVGIDGSCCRSYAGINIPDKELCPGQSGLILDNSRSGAGTTYKWKFMPDATPAASNQKDPPPVSFSGPGLKTIELVITDACGTDTAVEYLAMNELPPAYAGRDTGICFNYPVQLGEQGLAGLKYIWKPALYLNSDRRPDPTSLPQAAISYVLEVTDLYTSCINTDTVYIKKMPTPPLQGLSDTVKCDGMAVSIAIPVQNGIQYSWFDATASNPKLFMQAGTYWLKAATSCTDTTVYFTISDTACNCIVFLPNAFTPNDDVLNDGFGPESSCELKDYQIMVFNRWGEIIWISENPTDKWDGTYKGETVCNGVYFYTISYRRIVLNSSKFELKKGFVEVLK